MNLHNKKNIIDLESLINSKGISNLVLMEHAAHATFIFINKILDIKNTTFTILLGKGNNAGDGLALARMLLSNNAEVYLLKCFDNFISESSNLEYDILKKSYTINYCDINSIPKKSVIIDAVFGVGIEKELPDSIKTLFNYINSNFSIIISLDIPSGVNCDTGEVSGSCIKATYTVSYLLPKIGVYTSPGALYAGKVIENNLFINSDNLYSSVKLLKLNYIKSIFNKLKRVNLDSHKNNFGSIAVYASRLGMEGASSLVIEAAFKSGAGLVSLISLDEDIISLRNRFNLIKEAIFSKENLNSINKYDVLILGPGYDIKEEEILLNIFKTYKNKILIDASALRILSKNNNLSLIKDNKNVILTPHPGEIAALCKINNTTFNRLELINDFTSSYELICVLKGYRTIISNGKNISINATGNPALSKAGSGDVLAGLIASFWAQNLNAYESSELAVYIHGLIADSLLKKLSELSFTPQDIIDTLKEVLNNEYFY